MPLSQNDEYEQKCELNSYTRLKQQKQVNSKYIFKYTLNEQKLRAKFKQIVGFHFVSSFTQVGIDELSKELIKTTLQEKYIGEAIPVQFKYLKISNLFIFVFILVIFQIIYLFINWLLNLDF